MSVVSIVFLIIVSIAIVYFVMVYNGLINLRQNTQKAWSNIDVLLKQRHDEIPKLVEVCRQFREFEQATLEKVTQARNQAVQARSNHQLGALAGAEAMLSSGLGQIFATVEAYPELKTHEQFSNLQMRISALENAISDRREFYNDSVHLLNIKIQEFPDVLLARLCNFQEAEFLRISKAETADVNIKELFKG